MFKLHIKAQIAMEFLFIFMIFLLAIGIGLFIFWENTQKVNQYKIDLEIEKLLNLISNKINTVYLEGDGFSMNLTIPEKVLGMNYSLNISLNFILLNFSDNIYSKQLLTQNISGELKKGKNLLSNVDKDIIISQW